MNNCLFVEMQLATRIGIHQRLFSGAISYPKTSKICFWCSQFSQDYGLQSRNSAKLRHGWFHESALKYLHQTPWSKFRKTVYSGISDYWTKTLTADTGTCPERKECYKTSKIPKSPCKTLPFLLVLQACRPKFPTSANTVKGSEKKIHCKSLEIFANLSGRSLQ